jgi:sec-independent protein translocase protein TatA
MAVILLSQQYIIGFFGLGSPGVGELMVIAVVAVVLFGGKLPEVARTLGGTYQQFRKGLSDIQSTIKKDLDLDASSLNRLPEFNDVVDDYDEPTAPSFDSPPEDED